MAKTDKKLNEIFGIHNLDTIDEGELIVKDPELPKTELANKEYSEREIQKYEDDDIKNSASEDYEIARENLKNIIEKGSNLIDVAISVAESSEDAESIEAAISVLSKMADINSRLLDLTKKKQDVFSKTRPKNFSDVFGQGFSGGAVNAQQDNSVKNITNNYVFSGTTNDLAKMIKQMKEGEDNENTTE